MASPPIGALQDQLIPMTAAAASKAAASPAQKQACRIPCKPRASYLKPKEILESAQVAVCRRFDLQHPLNYLKVFAPSQADMIAS
jgi:hypothetical protein